MLLLALLSLIIGSLALLLGIIIMVELSLVLSLIMGALWSLISISLSLESTLSLVSSLIILTSSESLSELRVLVLLLLELLMGEWLIGLWSWLVVSEILWLLLEGNSGLLVGESVGNKLWDLGLVQVGLEELLWYDLLGEEWLLGETGGQQSEIGNREAIRNR